MRDASVFVGGMIDPDTRQMAVTLRIEDGEGLILSVNAAVAVGKMLGQWAGFAHSANEHMAMGGELSSLIAMPPEGNA